MIMSYEGLQIKKLFKIFRIRITTGIIGKKAKHKKGNKKDDNRINEDF